MENTRTKEGKMSGEGCADKVNYEGVCKLSPQCTAFPWQLSFERGVFFFLILCLYAPSEVWPVLGAGTR